MDQIPQYEGHRCLASLLFEFEDDAREEQDELKAIDSRQESHHLVREREIATCNYLAFSKEEFVFMNVAMPKEDAAEEKKYPG